MDAPGSTYAPPQVDRLVGDHLADLVDAPATAGVALPPDYRREGPPALVVSDDGGGILWPVKLDTTIRITVFAVTRSKARGMASWAMGIVMARRAPGAAQHIPGVAHLGNPSGILSAVDSRTGAYMASFTVAARARLTASQTSRYVP